MDSSRKKTSNPFQLLAAVGLALVLMSVGTGWTWSTVRSDSTDWAGSVRLDNADDALLLRTAVPQVDSLYGSRRLVVGEMENYRVRIKPGATWPISYRWDLGDGTRSIGNNVVHHYDAPGRYQVGVNVVNRHGSDTTSVWVTVVAPTVPTPESKPQLSAAASLSSGEQSGQPAQPVTIIPHGENTGASYYSWVLATYLNRSAANAAVRRFSELGIQHVRVYTDDSGKGTPAYRVVSGQYRSEQGAVANRDTIERIVERPIILIAIVRQ